MTRGERSVLALLLYFTALLPLYMACDSSSPIASAPPPDPVMEVLAPCAGQTFGAGDTVRIVSRCDYSAFASGVNIAVSMDAGEVWDLVCSRPRLTGFANDTFAWIPGQDYSDSILIGRGVQLMIYDYNRLFSAQAGMIYFTHD